MFSKLVPVFVAAACLASACARANDLMPVIPTNPPKIAAATNDPERAIKRFRLQPGIKASLFAAEPLLANPVAFCIDERGRFYVAETYRLHDGVTDIRNHMTWLDAELASTSVQDRIAYMKRFEGKGIGKYTRQSDRVRLLWDGDGDGKADHATVFADGFNDIADGIGAGVLANRGSVYYANIPNLWILRDDNRDGVTDTKRSLLTGFGVRVGFLGHDLHGLRMGPDGRLYFSVGDRGASVENKEHKWINNREEGAIYRCDLDGSNLEIFARGMRNPQELAFDEFGNLWTGDNNSDGGDPARWVYAVEGGDSGWRIGYQFIKSPSRGPWLTERMCYPHWPGQPAFIVPPIANIGNGPSGLTYYPGAGLSPRYDGHFFLCDFRGTTGSGVHSFGTQPRGAGFDVVDRHDFIWELLATDCEFGYDGHFYVSDWVEGWNKTGKGRIYRFTDPVQVKSRTVSDVKKLFIRGIHTLPFDELEPLLSHRDMRVRQEAQFAIVETGPARAATTLARVLRYSTNRFARIHSVWGLGQVARKYQLAIETLNVALRDQDPEIRAQAAKVLGENHSGNTRDMNHMLADEHARVRFFAAQALGKIGEYESMAPVFEMLRANNDVDPYLRHAGAMALASIMHSTNGESLKIAAQKFKAFSEACNDESDAVRMGALLALRRLESTAVGQFLHDPNPLLVAEAARAINDIPITNALSQLAALIADDEKLLAFPVGDATHPGPRDAVLQRVLNANYRVGSSNHAAALAYFAGASKAPDHFRSEALDLLGHWEQPSGRDRVTGLWRSLPPRNPAVAAAVLQPVIGGLQRSGSSAIKLAATRVAGSLNITNTGFDSFDLIRDVDAPPNVRLEALRTLASQKDPRLPDAVKVALESNDERLRSEGTIVQAQINPNDALVSIRKTLEAGSVREKQTAFAALGSMPVDGADELLAQWLEQFPRVAPEVSLDLLDAAAKRTNPTVKDKLEKIERSRPGTDDLRSYRECLVGGDAELGKQIFFERPEASCLRCHKFNGEGGEVGPEVAGIGSRQPRDYLLESIVYPNKHVAQGFESVIVTLRNGVTYAGPVKSETADALEINSGEDGVVRVRKSDIKSRDRGLSAMPEELRQVLTKQDIRNLVEFLACSREPAKVAPAATTAPVPAPAPPPKSVPPAE